DGARRRIKSDAVGCVPALQSTFSKDTVGAPGRNRAIQPRVVGGDRHQFLRTALARGIQGHAGEVAGRDGKKMPRPTPVGQIRLAETAGVLSPTAKVRIINFSASFAD